jgi:hypothetical protein
MGGLLKDRATWIAWFVLLKAFFGLPMGRKSLELFKTYSGRGQACRQIVYGRGDSGLSCYLF